MSEEEGRVHLNLDLSRSNLQRTPAWPVLLGNVVREARRTREGFPRRQLTLGEPLPVVTQPGARYTLVGPLGEKPVFGAGALTLPPPLVPGPLRAGAGRRRRWTWRRCWRWTRASRTCAGEAAASVRREARGEGRGEHGLVGPGALAPAGAAGRAAGGLLRHAAQIGVGWGARESLRAGFPVRRVQHSATMMGLATCLAPHPPSPPTVLSFPCASLASPAAWWIRS